MKLIKPLNYKIVKKETNRLFLTLFVCLCSFSITYSQPDPVKFGKVDRSLLEMKVYDKDTSADAVVVCDYGHNSEYSFERTYRLKILKKSGCDRGNFVIYNRSKSNFKGFTYNLINSEIVKGKLKSESIFEEKVVNSYYRYKISMPNVQVGSVIEIFIYGGGYPYKWYFQRDIPVLWSELRLYTRNDVGIQKYFYGFETLNIATNDRWVGKDMPALKAEPFMNDLDNFLTKFEFEISFVGSYAFATTWDAVNKYLLNETSVGTELKTMFFMAGIPKTIKDTAKSDRSKMIAAYETIKKKMKWNEQEWMYPEKNIGYTLSKGIGNAGEVNIALYLLLKRLDIEAYPVALSTRSNGMLSFIFPTLDKLNYMIVLAKINGEDILLDATDEYLPAGYLPERCINGNGRIVKDENSTWVGLKPGGKDKVKLYADVKVNEDGNINGDIYYTKQEYAGYLFRKKYSTFNDKNEYKKSFERENPGLKIIESSIQNTDSIYLPVNEKFNIEYKGFNDVTDTSITFFPFFIDRIQVNPFKLDERKIPIDFIYPMERNYNFKFVIPDNYKVLELPKSINTGLPNNKGKFTFNVSVKDSIIQIISNIAIYQPTFTQDEYPYIKQLYSEIVKKQSEPIIIIKK